MSDPNRALSEVPSLLEERRKYEGWIAALDARRESTPPHVFQRVHDDYRGRLKRVEEQLAAYRGAIEAERANVESRLGQIRREEQNRYDERAELDLRIQVGELSASDAGSTIRSLDDNLSQLARERERLDTQISAYSRLLGGAAAAPTRPPTPEPPRAAAPEPPRAAPPEPPPAPVPAPVSQPEPRVSATGGAFDELAFLSSVVEFERPTADPASAPAAPAANTNPPVTRALAEPAPPPSRVADIQDRDLEALAPRDEGGASLLTGVSGTAPTATHDSNASESMLRDLGSGAPRSETPSVVGRRATGAAPLTGRQTATAEQPKTLKCTECGAMNYPTEWYCERCGAELAAL
jgi:hypothetical protein